MHPFYNIWNAATFKRSSCRGGCILVIVGLISMIFGAYTDTEMMLCTDDSMPCVLTYGETMNVCDGDHAYANMTLRVGANISPNDITIMVLGHQFSKGPVVTGQFHNGDEQIDRWTNKISFQGNTITYELWNSGIKSKDEFDCNMEINFEGEKFISKHFKWFHVDSSNCITKPTCIKDTAEQYLENITEQLDQLRVSKNILAADMAEQKKMNIHLIHLLSQLANKTDGSIQRAVNYSDQLIEMLEGLKDLKIKLDTQNNRLDTSNKMDITQIVVLVLVLIISFVITVKIFIPSRVQKELQNKFSGLLDRIRCKKLPSSSSSDHSTARSQSSASRNEDEPSPSLASNNPQVSNTGEGSTPSNLIDLNSTVRPQSMPSPEDELHYEEEATDV